VKQILTSVIRIGTYYRFWMITSIRRLVIFWTVYSLY